MCIFAVWRGMTQNAYPKTAYGNAEMRTLRLHIKLRTVRGFTNKKSANSLKVSGFLNKKMRTSVRISRRERDSNPRCLSARRFSRPL